MRKLLSVVVALIGLSLVTVDADARRMSGGKNVGTQRQAVSPNKAAPKAPAQQNQAAPAQQQAAGAAAPAAAQQASGASRWLGPLAGLALGAGLAALFFNNGIGGALLGILLVAALAFGVFFLVRMLRGTRPVQEPLRYAGATPYGGSQPATPSPAPAPVSVGSGAAPHSVAATTQFDAPAAAPQMPADFDAEGFLRHARLHFVNLQSAHDRKDSSEIREFLTPQLFREIEADMRSMDEAPQKTDIVTLSAEVADLATENGMYIVSVRFAGLIRETPGTEPQPFAEIWHLEKPVKGRAGWLVSGIQQA